MGDASRFEWLNITVACIENLRAALDLGLLAAGNASSAWS